MIHNASILLPKSSTRSMISEALDKNWSLYSLKYLRANYGGNYCYKWGTHLIINNWWFNTRAELFASILFLKTHKLCRVKNLLFPKRFSQRFSELNYWQLKKNRREGYNYSHLHFSSKNLHNIDLKELWTGEEF